MVQPPLRSPEEKDQQLVHGLLSHLSTSCVPTLSFPRQGLILLESLLRTLPDERDVDTLDVVLRALKKENRIALAAHVSVLSTSL